MTVQERIKEQVERMQAIRYASRFAWNAPRVLLGYTAILRDPEVDTVDNIVEEILKIVEED